MKTNLILERFDPRMKLLERREQPSESYTLEFFRILYVQHTQSALYDIEADAQNLLLASPPGYDPYLYGLGQSYGIVVGEGTGAVSPLDTHLHIPIGHGKRYKGTPPQFTNPDFEAGDFTGWTTSGTPSVTEGGFIGSGGKYYCAMGSGDRSISQDIDLTNIVALIVPFVYKQYSSGFYFRILVDTDIVYEFEPGTGTYTAQLYLPIDYTGVQTVKFFSHQTGGYYTWLDNLLTVGKELEYGGSEVLEPIFAGANGEFSLRRLFTNHSGSSLTVNEAGVIAYPGRLVIHDQVSPGIALADGEILRVTYTPQITV